MTEQAIRVLLVEDEAPFADLLRHILAVSASSHCETVHAASFSQVLELVEQHSPDVVLLDLSLPDRRGLDTYNDLQTLWPLLPVIILTGLDDETLAIQAVRAGAQDYLMKGQFDGRMLARFIRYAIERKRGAE